MPWAASSTLGAQSRFRRSTKVLVKGAGRCSVTTVGGQSRGYSDRIASSASTPPVEAPMATRLPLGVLPADRSTRGGGFGPATRLPIRAVAADLTLSASSANELGCSTVG